MSQVKSTASASSPCDGGLVSARRQQRLLWQQHLLPAVCEMLRSHRPFSHAQTQRFVADIASCMPPHTVPFRLEVGECIEAYYVELISGVESEATTSDGVMSLVDRFRSVREASKSAKDCLQVVFYTDFQTTFDSWIHQLLMKVSKVVLRTEPWCSAWSSSGMDRASSYEEIGAALRAFDDFVSPFRASARAVAVEPPRATSSHVVNDEHHADASATNSRRMSPGDAKRPRDSSPLCLSFDDAVKVVEHYMTNASTLVECLDRDAERLGDIHETINRALRVAGSRPRDSGHSGSDTVTAPPELLEDVKIILDKRDHTEQRAWENVAKLQSTIAASKLIIGESVSRR